MGMTINIYLFKVGRSPIPQFDVFNLKPNRQYYFRVTAKSRKGIESEMMTKGRVDLSKATKMPVFAKELTPYVRVLKGQPLDLAVEYSGEPVPKVKWMRVDKDIETIEPIQVTETSSGVRLDKVTASNAGKYTCELSNAAGKVNTSCYVDVAETEVLFNSYERAKR